MQTTYRTGKPQIRKNLIIYPAGATAVGTCPVLDTSLTALTAGLVAGAIATGASNRSGARASVALDDAVTVAVATVFPLATAVRAGVFTRTATYSTADALLSIAEGAVPPAAASAESAVIFKFSGAGTAGALTVGGRHAC